MFISIACMEPKRMWRKRSKLSIQLKLLAQLNHAYLFLLMLTPRKQDFCVLSMYLLMSYGSKDPKTFSALVYEHKWY